jgi:hypothetical protein
MGIFDNLKREETEFEKRFRARREELGGGFNDAWEILMEIRKMAPEAREEVLYCLSQEVVESELELVQERDHFERVKGEFETTRQKWTTQYAQEKKYIQKRKEQLDNRELDLANALREAEQIKARAYNAMKMAERIKRKAEKKIANFEALVDR